MNNYWHTNYKADQEGVAVFRYSLCPHGVFNPTDAERFGIERSQPLLAMGSMMLSSYMPPQISIEPNSVIATSLTPGVERESWMLRVFNAGDAEANVQVHWKPDGFRIVRCDISGTEQNLPMTLPPRGVMTLKIRR